MPAINYNYSHREIAQYREGNEEASARRLNLVRKWQSCLKCGKSMLTDRCHRICAKCHKANGKTRDKQKYRITADTDINLSTPREDIFLSLTTNYSGNNNHQDDSSSLDTTPYVENPID